MRNLIFYGLSAALLLVFWLGLKFLLTGINQEFGWGVGTGFAIALVIFYVGELAGFKEPRY